MARIRSRLEMHAARAAADDFRCMSGRDGHLTDEVNQHIMRSIDASGTRLLDLGCGDGSLLKLLSPVVAEALGVAPTAAEVDRLRRVWGHQPNVRFEVGTAEHVDSPSASVDVIVCNGVLMCLDGWAEAQTALLEMRRLLVDGGVLFAGETPIETERPPFGGARTAPQLIAYFVRARRLRDAAHVARRAGATALGLDDWWHYLPAPGFVASEDDFLELARTSGFTGAAVSSNPHAPNRRDYLLRAQPTPARRTKRREGVGVRRVPDSL